MTAFFDETPRMREYRERLSAFMDHYVLTELPRWHREDGGRYINTYQATVTMDPDTGDHNIGIYRGMLGQKAEADADKAKACSLDSQYC